VLQVVFVSVKSIENILFLSRQRRGKLVRFKTLFYSLATGAYSLWELLTVPVRTSKDYICDYGEVKKYQ